MRALLASTLLSLQIVLLSAHPHTSQESGDHLPNSSQEPGGEHVLIRQTRESHHLSRPSSPDTRRSRVLPASPRPSRAFRLVLIYLQIIVIFIVVKCLIIVISGNHRQQRRAANLNLLQKEELSSLFFSQLRFVSSLNLQGTLLTFNFCQI